MSKQLTLTSGLPRKHDDPLLSRRLAEHWTAAETHKNDMREMLERRGQLLDWAIANEWTATQTNAAILAMHDSMVAQLMAERRLWEAKIKLSLDLGKYELHRSDNPQALDAAISYRQLQAGANDAIRALTDELRIIYTALIPTLFCEHEKKA